MKMKYGFLTHERHNDRGKLKVCRFHFSYLYFECLVFLRVLIDNSYLLSYTIFT